jgi:hypothetical protein
LSARKLIIKSALVEIIGLQAASVNPMHQGDRGQGKGPGR